MKKAGLGVLRQSIFEIIWHVLKLILFSRTTPPSEVRTPYFQKKPYYERPLEGLELLPGIRQQKQSVRYTLGLFKLFRP